MVCTEYATGIPQREHNSNAALWSNKYRNRRLRRQRKTRHFAIGGAVKQSQSYLTLNPFHKSVRVDIFKTSVRLNSSQSVRCRPCCKGK